MLIDTHCHLDAAEFDPDRSQLVERYRAAGVSGIVIPTIGRINFDSIAGLCREYPECRAAYGIHPMYVDRAEPGDLDILKQMLVSGKPVAVGEIGLDRFVAERDDARQELFFVEQLKLARELDLPVLLHVRRAIDPVLKQLRRMRVVGGIAHAFNGSRQQAVEFIKLDFKLGFGGAMTWPRANRIRELAATLPLASIVLETDAPDIPPVWVGQGRNEPVELPRIAQELAILRDISVQEVIEATGANARKVLPNAIW